MGEKSTCKNSSQTPNYKHLITNSLILCYKLNTLQIQHPTSHPLTKIEAWTQTQIATDKTNPHIELSIIPTNEIRTNPIKACQTIMIWYQTTNRCLLLHSAKFLLIRDECSLNIEHKLLTDVFAWKRKSPVKLWECTLDLHSLSLIFQWLVLPLFHVPSFHIQKETL